METQPGKCRGIAGTQRRLWSLGSPAKIMFELLLSPVENECSQKIIDFLGYVSIKNKNIFSV